MDAQGGRGRGESLEAELLDASQLEAIIAAQQEEEDAAQLAAALEMSTLDAAAFGNDALLADSGDFEGGEDGADSDGDFDADAFDAPGLSATEFAAFTVPSETASAHTPVGGLSTAAVGGVVPASAAAATAATVPAARRDHAHAVEVPPGGPGAGAGALFAQFTPAPRFAPGGLPDWARTIATVGAAAGASAAATVATVRAEGESRGYGRGSDRFSAGSAGTATSSFPDVSPPIAAAAAAAAAGSARAGGAAVAGATGARLAGARLRSLLEDADADSKHIDSDDDDDDGCDDDDDLAAGQAGQLGAADRYSFARGDHHPHGRHHDDNDEDDGTGPVTPVGAAAAGLAMTPPLAAAAAAAPRMGGSSGGDGDGDDADDDGMDADGESDIDADAAEGAEAEEEEAAGDAAADAAAEEDAEEGEPAAEGEGEAEAEGEAEPSKPLGFYITASIAEAEGVPYTGLVEGEDAVALEVDIPPQEPLRSLLKETIVCVTSARAGCSIPELLDPDTARCFWQSDGAAPHALTLQFYRRVSLAEVCLYLDFTADESYCPQEIHIKCGNSVAELSELRKITLSEPAGWVRFPFIDAAKRGLRRYLRTQVVQLVITSNHANGRDCHVRGLHVFGPFSDPRLASAAERGWGFGAGVGAAAASDAVEAEAAAGGDEVGLPAAGEGTFGGAAAAGGAAALSFGGTVAAAASDFGFSFGLFDSIR